VLVIIGLGAALFSLQVVVDPAGARCGLSRAWLDAVNEDKKEWNNVDTGGKKGKELACADALGLADEIRLEEKDPSKTATLPSESVLRIQYLISLIIGAAQVWSGIAVLRTRSRLARNIALGSSAAGLLLPAGFIVQFLGIFSALIFVFLGYALAFSPASREIWPKEVRG
jgi:hypothetical protein